MPRDFKIGMMVGLIMVVGIIIWLSTRDSLSLQARRAQKHQALLHRQTQSNTNEASPVPGAATHRAEASGVQQDGAPLPDVSAQSPPSPEPTGTSATPSPAAAVSSQRNDALERERPKIKTTKFHIVRSGDTLSGISQQYYGTVREIKKIVDANPKVLKNPHRILPGMKLTIPD